MLNDLVLNIAPFVEQYGAIAVFVLAIVEEIIAPIPSSIALMAAGFFLLPASPNFLELIVTLFFRLVLPGAFGLTIGSFLIYSVAYVGGEPLIRKIGRRFGVSWNKIEAVREKLSSHSIDEWIIFGLRSIPIVPNVLVSLGCGLIRYPLRGFLVPTFFGSAVRALLMGLIGWSFGEAYSVYATEIAQIGNYFLAISMVVVFIIGIWLLVKRKKTMK
ncbi:VTT domain-containing protein [Candidatus Jorgensenbacteria bacterium]|nr:VTT domain-containing protein [Candidatus Jorgensenbacteria bacterium]